MRDGTLLAGDLYLPREGVFPTLLCKTPYDRTRPAVYPEIARVPRQRLRRADRQLPRPVRLGRGGERAGDRGLGPAPDGYDTIEWAAAPAVVDRRRSGSTGSRPTASGS